MVEAIHPRPCALIHLTEEGVCVVSGSMCEHYYSIHILLEKYIYLNNISETLSSLSLSFIPWEELMRYHYDDYDVSAATVQIKMREKPTYTSTRTAAFFTSSVRKKMAPLTLSLFQARFLT